MKRFAFSDYPENGFDVAFFDGAFRERLNKKIGSRSSVFLDMLELPAKKAFIVYDKKKRVSGQSKWTFSKKIRLFTDSMIRYTNLPQYFMALSFAWAGVAFWFKNAAAAALSAACLLFFVYGWSQKKILKTERSHPFVIAETVVLQ